MRYWVFATHSKDRSQVELFPQVGVVSYKLNLWRTLRYGYPSPYMASAIAWEALAIPCSVADCNCAEADWKASQDIDTSRRWFQMLKWFGVPKKLASKMPHQSWFPWFPWFPFKICVLVCLKLILTSWSHTSPGFFRSSAPNKPGTHSSHGLGTLHLLHQLHEACQQTIQLLSHKNADGIHGKPTEESFIFGGLVTSPIYFLGPKILKPSFVHGFFGGPFWIFDGFLLKCFDSSLQLLGISNRQKHTDTHTHIQKKNVYIYILYMLLITRKLPTNIVPNLKGPQEIPGNTRLHPSSVVFWVTSAARASMKGGNLSKPKRGGSGIQGIRYFLAVQKLPPQKD